MRGEIVRRADEKKKIKRKKGKGKRGENFLFEKKKIKKEREKKLGNLFKNFQRVN